MSYMRGDIYIWHGSDDELVEMRWAQLSPEEQEAAKKRAIEKWGENFGCHDLKKVFGG